MVGLQILVITVEMVAEAEFGVVAVVEEQNRLDVVLVLLEEAADLLQFCQLLEQM